MTSVGKVMFIQSLQASAKSGQMTSKDVDDIVLSNMMTHDIYSLLSRQDCLLEDDCVNTRGYCTSQDPLQARLVSLDDFQKLNFSETPCLLLLLSMSLFILGPQISYYIALNFHCYMITRPRYGIYPYQPAGGLSKPI